MGLLIGQPLASLPNIEITKLNHLVFATNNQHKVEEIRQQLGSLFEIITLREAGIDIDIPEPYNTLAANASEKSGVILQLTGKDCFSEDTGLEVRALNGAPGVKSARYAGEGKSSEDNIDKLLQEMERVADRCAQFRTVISLRQNGQEFLFEGICPGIITSERKGGKGFGYDPVFIPAGSQKSFAEMTMAEKSAFSHRGRALKKLVAFLNEQKG